MMILLIASLCTGVTFEEPATTPYPRTDLLVEPGDVKDKFLVLDARTKAKYEACHLPKAIWVDVAAWGKAFGDGSDAVGWSKRIGDVGITPKDKIVIYDDTTKEAARLWWLLRYWGFEDVRLLNGGWAGWMKFKGPLETTPPPALKPGVLTLKPHRERLATKQELLDALMQDKLQIVDARSEGEFCGTEKLAKKAGAIPTAKHLDWSDLVEPDTQRFKPAPELHRLFRAADIDLNKPTAAHCQSGGRSSVMVFALELMGAKDARNYYASWAEWGNAEDTPVVKPEKK